MLERGNCQTVNKKRGIIKSSFEDKEDKKDNNLFLNMEISKLKFQI